MPRSATGRRIVSSCIYTAAYRTRERIRTEWLSIDKKAWIDTIVQ
jgi:hypothetical protein